MILSMPLDHNPYDIHIGKNMMAQLKNLITKVYDGKKIFIITDTLVFSYHQEYLLKRLIDFEVEVVSINPGEASKSIETFEKVCDELIEKGIKRGHLLIAFGGGVVGDLTGFVAATLYRGIDYIQIPTSLLAMVDASIGGKTGINSNKGKNLIGAFNQPKLVLIDTLLLRTLDKLEYQNGMAEVVKSGFIGDPMLITQLLSSPMSEDEMIKRSIEVKRKFVLMDEFDHKERMFLNFGHTFGHAIEKKSNYHIKHGFAVSVGMQIACEIGIKLGITPEATLFKLNQILSKYGLNKTIVNPNNYINEVFFDKKNINDSLNMVFVADLGTPLLRKITKEELHGCFNRTEEVKG